MSKLCLLCGQKEKAESRTNLCDDCYNNAGEYIDTNIHLMLALSELVTACETALAEFHCPDGDDAECGVVAALKDALAMTKKP